MALGGTWPPGGVSHHLQVAPGELGWLKAMGSSGEPAGCGHGSISWMAGEEDVSSQLISMGLNWGSRGVPQYRAGL